MCVFNALHINICVGARMVKETEQERVGLSGRQAVEASHRWLGPWSSAALERRAAKPDLCGCSSCLGDWPKVVMVAVKLKQVS